MRSEATMATNHIQNAITGRQFDWPRFRECRPWLAGTRFARRFRSEAIASRGLFLCLRLLACAESLSACRPR